MSTLVISALAAAAFVAVPPSIGSEPVPANFDYVAAPALYVAFEGPNLLASLGTEPFVVDPGAGTSSVSKPGTRAPGPATLAASLGSEPFLVGFDEIASPGAPRVDERRPDERLACNCACK
jgi:hypothetical protein